MREGDSTLSVSRRRTFTAASPNNLSESGVRQLILAYKAKGSNGAVVSDFQPRQGFIYTQVRAISARVNQNYDAWPSPELKKSYRTFLGKPVFVNHNNFDPSRARGRVIAARYVESGNDKYIEVIQEIDAQRFPKLAKEIRDGGMDSVSMGVEAGFTICSYCDNKATDVFDMCDHVKHHKGEKLRRVGKNGKPENVLVYENCYKLGFFELSYVFDPADETAVVSKVVVANNKTAMPHRHKPEPQDMGWLEKQNHEFLDDLERRRKIDHYKGIYKKFPELRPKVADKSYSDPEPDPVSPTSGSSLTSNDPSGMPEPLGVDGWPAGGIPAGLKVPGMEVPQPHFEGVKMPGEEIGHESPSAPKHLIEQAEAPSHATEMTNKYNEEHGGEHTQSASGGFIGNGISNPSNSFTENTGPNVQLMNSTQSMGQKSSRLRQKAWQKRSFGETAAPEDVNTLRNSDKEERNDFRHWVESPDELQDPDLDAKQEMNSQGRQAMSQRRRTAGGRYFNDEGEPMIGGAEARFEDYLDQQAAEEGAYDDEGFGPEYYDEDEDDPVEGDWDDDDQYTGPTFMEYEGRRTRFAAEEPDGDEMPSGEEPSGGEEAGGGDIEQLIGEFVSWCQQAGAQPQDPQAVDAFAQQAQLSPEEYQELSAIISNAGGAGGAPAGPAGPPQDGGGLPPQMARRRQANPSMSENPQWQKGFEEGRSLGYDWGESMDYADSFLDPVEGDWDRDEWKDSEYGSDHPPHADKAYDNWSRATGKGKKGMNMGASSLASRGRVASRGQRRHFTADENGYTDGGPYGRNDEGEQEEVFITQVPGTEGLSAPVPGDGTISNTENTLVARVRRGTEQLRRDAAALKRIQMAKRRMYAADGGLPDADAVDPPLSGTDDQSLKSDDHQSVQPDKVETQPRDASRKAFAAFDDWLRQTTGRTAMQHNANYLRRQATRWAKSQGASVEILFPTLRNVLRQARIIEKEANMRRTADEKLELAAPQDRIDVEAPVSNVTDQEAQASQFDLRDFGNNAGDGIADPDLGTGSQIWAPGEGQKSARKADGVAAVRCAEAYIQAGLAPESERWKLAAQFQTMRHATVVDRTRLLEAVIHTTASRRKVTAGTNRGTVTRSAIPAGFSSRGMGRTAGMTRTAQNDPSFDCTLFI